ncbi:MAG: response regulator [Thermoguttaceae bacterium]|nr:response regulator [Thermoguttaceae bacterium]
MTRGRILIVDDSEINVEILKEILSDSYQLATASTGEECLNVIREFAPDLVLLDVMMPGISGYEVCRRIKASPVGAFTQVILVSGKASKTERLQGYEAGADDYVVKPFDHDELLAKVRVQFRLRAALAKVWEADAKLRAFNEDLERLVEQRTAQVVGMRDLTIFALARLAESRDPETGAHLERIRNYSRILAEQLSMQGPYTGQIDDAFISDIYRSSPLHDIGKVGIPDAILLKAGRLTREEFEVMKRHTVIGAETLEQAARQAVGCGHFLTMAREVARHHHERFDGSGYPDGLAADDIPLAARIVSLADVYDALTTRRVYKEAFTHETAWSIIEEGRGTQFDPAVYDAFVARREDFLAVHEESERLAAEELAGVSALDAGR